MPGLELSRRFYAESVRPLLDAAHPGLAHSAARMDSGSEVLGFDTELSADHEWGPRVTLFLDPENAREHGPGIVALLSERLPRSFLGYPTSFEPAGAATATMTPPQGPVHHRVGVTDTGTFTRERLGFDARSEPTLLDWLATPTQRLAEVTGGAVFHDGLGELAPVRERLAWYPRDVWAYVLAAQWTRIGQEEAFPGRCAGVGDDEGSAVVTARLVRDVMRLFLLLHRRWPPYAKWLGTAFARLPGVEGARAAMGAAMAAGSWAAREDALVAVVEAAARRHLELGHAGPPDPTVGPYFDRPFRVIRADRFSADLRAGIEDLRVAPLPPVGAVDQWVDSTDALGDPARLRAAVAAVLGVQWPGRP